MNALDFVQVVFSTVIAILVIDVVIIWCGGFPFPMKHKKKFILTNGNVPSKSYLINVDNINFIEYDNVNDVARIYFGHSENWIEIDISNPLTKEDFIYSLNHTNDFLVEGDN